MRNDTKQQTLERFGASPAFIPAAFSGERSQPTSGATVDESRTGYRHESRQGARTHDPIPLLGCAAEVIEQPSRSEGCDKRRLQPGPSTEGRSGSGNENRSRGRAMRQVASPVSKAGSIARSAERPIGTSASGERSFCLQPVAPATTQQSSITHALMHASRLRRNVWSFE